MFGRHHEHRGRHDRHHDCAPGGRWGRGRRPGDDDEGFGRGGFFGGRGSRMFGHGDLRLVLLALIAEKPRHGYELIRAIEEKFGGNYAPSPGAVYPTLTLLEEQDYVVAEAREGTKKLYQVTETGRQFLEENSVALKGIQARMDLAAQAFAMHSTPESVREAIRTLKQSLHMRRGPWTAEEAERVRKLIEATARQIVGGPEN
ncbi:PadR family transcriptional regulator [Aestuariivirga sp. YIM B02566]|uniref:PadR family transcriptional regulator n=1 Tax=Taklimakanibacter albus TaxID=2800327 RepID=A0ACC5QYJ9_9HYPH|nr:PadR family transcriptional regulator [Aestuariivirga sp. YIM B02566]MBK1865439.1 PadR family transcriptional regulator [Aestuariivirga sp. YIM B02566]